jgi:hypothetical protein
LRASGGFKRPVAGTLGRARPHARPANTKRGVGLHSFPDDARRSRWGFENSHGRDRTILMETTMKGFLNPFTGRPCTARTHVVGLDRCTSDDERGELLFSIPNYSEELEKTKRRQAVIDRLKEITNG